MENIKTGVFSVVGRPNVGKSTLTNALCGTKVAIVTSKPQTTRTRITGILNGEGFQLVFLDTPGLHKPKTSLGEYMVRRVYEAVSDVDTVMLVVEPSARIGTPEQMLIDKIKEFDMPAILVINKADTLKGNKTELLKVIDVYSQAHEFLHIIPVSAKHGEGLDTLLRELKGLCIDSPPLFPPDMVSDQPERQLIAEIVREKLLMCLNEELPHGIAVELEEFEEQENGTLNVSALIYCERKSHKGMIIGKSGALLKKVGQMARQDIEQMTGQKVFLQLWVKVKEDWRKNPYQIGNMGFRE